MTPIQKACYALIISAFILGALLVACLQDRITPRAQANLINNTHDSLTMMTAPAQIGQESLFILDNDVQKILVYNLDPGRRRMAMVGSVDLANLFGNHHEIGGGGGENAGEPGRVPR